MIIFGAFALTRMEQFFDEIKPILEKTILSYTSTRDEEIVQLKRENERYILLIIW